MSGLGDQAAEVVRVYGACAALPFDSVAKATLYDQAVDLLAEGIGLDRLVEHAARLARAGCDVSQFEARVRREEGHPIRVWWTNE